MNNPPLILFAGVLVFVVGVSAALAFMSPGMGIPERPELPRPVDLGSSSFSLTEVNTYISARSKSESWCDYALASYLSKLSGGVSLEEYKALQTARCTSCGAMAKGKCEYCGQLV